MTNELYDLERTIPHMGGVIRELKARLKAVAGSIKKSSVVSGGQILGVRCFVPEFR